jgi:hypothetical protein
MAGKPTETVLDIINQRMIPNEQAKKARGEVFTPISLVCEIMYGLRKAPLEKGVEEVWGIDLNKMPFNDPSGRVGGIPLEIWQNPDSKWLDPANGIGNFPFVVFQMLDFQLKDKLKDTVARRKHIVEKMLFMIEIDKGNVNTTFKIFEQLAPGSTPNICCADTLKLKDADLMKEFGVSKFDVIMGNPPFNEGGTKHHGGRGFYSQFIQFGIDALTETGCLVFITPPNFHRINKDNNKIKIKKFFSENNLIFLRIIPNTKKYFDVQISIDYYIVQKGQNKKLAVIYDKHNHVTEGIDISIFDVVPNFGFDVIKRLVETQTKSGKFTTSVGRSSANHASLSQLFNEGTFPIVHLINANGIRVLLSNKKHPYQNTPKMIINGLGVPYVLDDESGKYGLTQLGMFVLNPSTNDRIFMLSKLFQYLNWAFRIQGNLNDPFLFKIMPDLNKLEYTDEASMIKALRLEQYSNEINKYKVPIFQNVDKIDTTKGKKSKIVEEEDEEDIEKGGRRRTQRARRRGTARRGQ